MEIKLKTEMRFYKRVNMDNLDGCWEWEGAKNPGGYGLINIKGKKILAHRLSWIINHQEIPEGLCVLHSCDNPPCVNPAHLWLGTRADNVRDAYLKGRCRGGNGPRRKTSHTKLT